MKFPKLLKRILKITSTTEEFLKYTNGRKGRASKEELDNFNKFRELGLFRLVRMEEKEKGAHHFVFEYHLTVSGRWCRFILKKFKIKTMEDIKGF